jgi:hypothetical protein
LVVIWKIEFNFGQIKKHVPLWQRLNIKPFGRIANTFVCACFVGLLGVDVIYITSYEVINKLPYNYG